MTFLGFDIPFPQTFSSINLDAGEFPLKLKIHFRHPEDRPLTMEHQVKALEVLKIVNQQWSIVQLKLDKTYTGLQTLGAESCVEVCSIFYQRTNSKLRK